MSVIWLVLIAILLVGVAARVRAVHNERLARIRATWGAPIDRLHWLDAIADSHRSRVAQIDGGTSLDDRTWKDLDLDAVFIALDRTQSTLGQHALYHRLRTSPRADHLDAFEALVSRMTDDGSSRERAQAALARLQDPHGYNVWWLARSGAIETRRWHVLFPVLTSTAIAAVVTVLIWPSFGPAALALLALNVAIHFTLQVRVASIAGALRQVAPLIATGESLRFLRGPAIEPIVGCLDSELPRLRRLKTIARWASGDPLMLSFSPSVLVNVATDLANAFYDYLNLVLLLDGNGVYFSSRDLRTHRLSLLGVVSAIGDVDAAISVASYRASRTDWVRPCFRPAGAPARMIDVRHPLVPDAVANAITLSPSEGVLVTGSNMSGKSTFLRTIGVTAVLAQTINTCLASEYDAPEFVVRSFIGRSDDLLSGRSYYMDEVEALLALTRAAARQHSHLFLLDELFRGTNAVERIAVGQAVLRELLAADGDARPHVAVVATHDAELTELLADRFAAYHFGDEIGPGGLVFDYRLRPGRATSRNAIALLRLHGASAALLDSAIECASALDRERGISVTAR